MVYAVVVLGFCALFLVVALLAEIDTRHVYVEHNARLHKTAVTQAELLVNMSTTMLELVEQNQTQMKELAFTIETRRQPPPDG